MLERCLRNLASVTVDCEIVVVDDASPDDLRQVVNAAGDARIRFFRNPKNLGIPGNFNRALAEARGTYVCMLGDDDQFLPGNFEKKLAVLEANPHVGFVYSPWNAVTPEGRVVYSRLAAHPQQSYIGGRREFMDLFTGNYINLAAIVFRRSLLEKHGAFDERLTTLCDWDMFLRWSRQTETAYLAEALATVLVHDDSDTARRGLQEQRFAKEKLAVWRKWLIEQQPSLVIDDETWLRMAQFFSADLSHWFGSDT
ncbi:MAG TPA: glycosyltransferase, partial [Chloroflexota bacterium]